MLIIGITGNLASGKTTVARMFKQQGALVLDADKIAHKAICKDSVCYRKIVRVFGRGCLNKNDTISRQKLAKAAFGNRTNQKQLISIIHPWVIGTITKRLKQYRRQKKYKAAVVDAVLLIESGLYKKMDVNIVVKSTPAKQLERVLKYRDLSMGEARQRMKFQMPLAEKIKYADYVIDNQSTLKNTEQQVRRLWKNFKFG